MTRIEEALKLVSAQIAATKYSNVPPKELQKHRAELVDVRRGLASLPRDIPNFWPASFQVITLLSQATADLKTLQKETEKENEVSDVRSTPIGGIQFSDSRTVLKNSVAGVVFRNSIIRFDPSVRLENDVFYNCIFIFPVEQNPSKILQEIGNILLTSDLSKITLNAS